MTTSTSTSNYLDQFRRDYISSEVDGGSGDNNNDLVNGNRKCRKPSYVGLSCAVSGYSNYTRYQSPSRKTSPSQIPVQSGPQTLDAALNNVVDMRQQDHHRTSPPIRGQVIGDCTDDAPRSRTSVTSRKVHVESRNLGTLETVQKYYDANNLREGSPGSDCSGSSSIGSAGSSNGSGTLVQKQIERLYGGRVQPIRMTSPEPRSPDKSFEEESKNGGGFFAKRFGVVKQKDYSTISHKEDSPLEFKSLKVPAVFQLLRPEFREQLKSNSCQVIIPTEGTPVSSLGYRVTTSSFRQSRQERSNGAHIAKTTTTAVKERVIPIKIQDKERLIPIETQPQMHNLNNNHDRSPPKPALPAKPLSPPPPPVQKPLHVVTSPTLVANCFNKPDQKELVVKEKPQVVEQKPEVVEQDVVEQEVVEKKPVSPVAQKEDEVFVEEEYEEDYFRQNSPPCGLRERALLCPIQEEDAESTASASSFSVGKAAAAVAVAASNGVASHTNGVKPSTVEKTEEDSKEEVHDGHYFIRILENEIFKFEEQICDFEEDLAGADDEAKKIPEDVRDSILAAIGKAKLLTSQKLAQFRGLCDKNIDSTLVGPFVPTSEDLAGFWDMVYIQIEHVHSLFAELRQLKKEGWVSQKPLNISSSTLNGRRSSPTKKRTSPKAPSPANKSAGSTPESDKKRSQAAKARDEARKKMMEQKRKMMKQKQHQQQSETEIEVFVK